MNLETLPSDITVASRWGISWIQISNVSDKNYWIKNVNPDGVVQDLSMHGEIPAQTLDIKISTWPGAL